MRKKLPLNHSYYPHCESGTWIVVYDLHHYPSVFYLSLTFQISQTAVVKVEMSSTFPTVPVKLSNSQL